MGKLIRKINYGYECETVSTVVTQEFEDTKGVIRIWKSKDRQRKGQKKKDKQRSTKHIQKSEGELMCSGRVSSSCSTSGIRCINLVTNPVINHE